MSPLSHFIDAAPRMPWVWRGTMRMRVVAMDRVPDHQGAEVRIIILRAGIAYIHRAAICKFAPASREDIAREIERAFDDAEGAVLHSRAAYVGPAPLYRERSGDT